MTPEEFEEYQRKEYALWCEIERSLNEKGYVVPAVPTFTVPAVVLPPPPPPRLPPPPLPPLLPGQTAWDAYMAGYKARKLKESSES